MRVYLAAAYERQEEMRGVRDILAAYGHEVTSTWIDRTEEPPGGLGATHLLDDPKAGTEFARIDLMDLDAAEVVVSFTGMGTRGGRQVDYGFALGRSKYLIGVGPREHIFHTLAAEWYPDWTGLIMAITGRPPISALYFLHPDPAHATDEIPLVIDNGAPADPGPETQWWPFTPVDAKDVARRLGVPQKEDS